MRRKIGVTRTPAVSERQNSIFAKALLRVLRANDGPLLGQDLARQVQTDVNYTARTMEYDQRPQYGPLNLAGHEAGDFVFVPKE